MRLCEKIRQMKYEQILNLMKVLLWILTLL